MSKKKKPFVRKKDTLSEQISPVYNPDIIEASFISGSMPGSLNSSLSSSLSRIVLPIENIKIELSDELFDKEKEKKGIK